MFWKLLSPHEPRESMRQTQKNDVTRGGLFFRWSRWKKRQDVLFQLLSSSFPDIVSTEISNGIMFLNLDFRPSTIWPARKKPKLKSRRRNVRSKVILRRPRTNLLKPKAHLMTLRNLSAGQLLVYTNSYTQGLRETGSFGATRTRPRHVIYPNF